MSNQLLQKANAEAIFDSIAKQYQIMLAAVGTDAAEATTYAKGASNLNDDLASLIASNLWLADLADSVAAFTEAAQMSGAFMQAAGDVIRAIEQHVRKRHPAYLSLNDWLAGVGIKVHPYCKAIHSAIAAAHVWPLNLETTDGTNDEGNEVANLGVITMASAGTPGLTALTAINKGLYGDGLIKLVVDKSGGLGAGSALLVTLTGKDFNDSTVTGAMTVTAAAADKAEFDVPSTRFCSITSVTVTNGTAADKLLIQFRDDRTPTL